MRSLNRSTITLLSLLTVGCIAVLQAKPNYDYKANKLRSDYSHDYWVTVPVDTLRQFEAFTVSFDGADDNDGGGKPDAYGIPEWVAYEIKARPPKMGKAPGRPKTWMTDKILFKAGLAPADDSYAFSKKQRETDPDNPMFQYDRGHMCRKSTAFRLGKDADYNTHTVLNACPQLSDLNQGIWEDLEDRIEAWADTYDSLWVICGPVFYGRSPKAWLGEEGEFPVAIPDAFFKIVVKNGFVAARPDVLAFIYPQTAPREKPYTDNSHLKYLVTVDRIEELTGLDFLTRLPDAVEESIESRKTAKLWIH